MQDQAFEVRHHLHLDFELLSFLDFQFESEQHFLAHLADK